MSLTPFADVQAMIDGGVEQALANATATWQGGAPFGVIFERGVVEAAQEVIGYGPRVSLPAARVVGIVQGATLTVGGTAYIVAGVPEPDEGGWLQNLPLR